MNSPLGRLPTRDGTNRNGAGQNGAGLNGASLNGTGLNGTGLNRTHRGVNGSVTGGSAVAKTVRVSAGAETAAADHHDSASEAGSELSLIRRFAERTANAVVALSLILVGLPLFVVIGIAVLVLDGRPILYKGQRLGKNRRPFTMYKFRTLVRGANAVVGSELLSARHRLTIPGGQFLRDSRLDELPQLFNILKGDMNFLGPRPERREIYESLYKPLVNHERLFSVRPGLVGFSQLFTPHGSPKRLRVFADYHVMSNAPSQLRGWLLVGRAALSAVWTAVLRMIGWLWVDLIKNRLVGAHADRREYRRVRPQHATVLLAGALGRTLKAPVIDVNEEALLLESPEQLEAHAILPQFKIEVRFQRNLAGSSARTRTVRCSGEIVQARTAAGRWLYVVRYEPLTGLSRYFVHQYLLRGSLADPFRPLNRANVERACTAALRPTGALRPLASRGRPLHEQGRERVNGVSLDVGKLASEHMPALSQRARAITEYR